jgi:hypothetical protein
MATEHPADPARLAADARSIFACPDTVSLVVEGEARAIDDGGLGLTETDGTPTFVCQPDSPVARAARVQSSALLTVTSGLGAPGGLERTDTLVLAGRLEEAGVEHCACCDDVRQLVTLRLNFVVLTKAALRSGPCGREEQFRIPLQMFCSREHQLNRGHLQRIVQHANDVHHDELRNAVSHATRTRPGDLLAVQLTHLTPSSVEVAWVDLDGAHRGRIDFPRAARDVDELGNLLRRSLHAGLC